MSETLKPFIAIGPGDTIKDELEERGWTQQDLSDITGMSLKNINHLLNNKISISTEMAKLLSKAFGQSVNFWINLDVNYRLRLEEETKQEIEAEVKAEIYKYMPIIEMVKKGWIKKAGTLNTLKNQVKKFWGINNINLSFLEENNMPAFRTSDAFKARFNYYYSEVWHRMAENCSETLNVPKYNKELLQDVAEHFHSMTTEPDGVKKIITAFNNAGVKFLVLSHLKNTYLDGAAFMHKGNPVIVYTMRYDRIDNFFFVIAHELAHVLLHLDESPEGFMDDLGADAANERENEANEFAQKILHIDKLLECRDHYALREDVVREKAAEYEVHPAIVLGAMQKKSGNYRSTLNKKLKEKVSELLPESVVMG